MIRFFEAANPGDTDLFKVAWPLVAQEFVIDCPTDMEVRFDGILAHRGLMAPDGAVAWGIYIGLRGPIDPAATFPPMTQADPPPWIAADAGNIANRHDQHYVSAHPYRWMRLTITGKYRAEVYGYSKTDQSPYQNTDGLIELDPGNDLYNRLTVKLTDDRIGGVFHLEQL